MTAPRVVGLDLSLTSTGMACADGTTETGVTRTTDGDRRLAVIGRAVRGLLADDVVVPPATLKSYATGSGNTGKPQMAVAAYKRAGREFGSDDECDAWWLRAAGMQHLGHPVVQVPAAQVTRLDAVQWPEVTL